MKLLDEGKVISSLVRVRRVKPDTRCFASGKTKLTWTLRIVFLLWLVVSIVLILTAISHACTI
jgi:hypothetical protein